MAQNLLPPAESSERAGHEVVDATWEIVSASRPMVPKEQPTRVTCSDATREDVIATREAEKCLVRKPFTQIFQVGGQACRLHERAHFSLRPHGSTDARVSILTESLELLLSVISSERINLDSNRVLTNVRSRIHTCILHKTANIICISYLSVTEHASNGQRYSQAGRTGKCWPRRRQATASLAQVGIIERLGEAARGGQVSA